MTRVEQKNEDEDLTRVDDLLRERRGATTAGENEVVPPTAPEGVRFCVHGRTPLDSSMAKRYCEMCDEWMSARECRKCGAPTVQAAPPATDAVARCSTSQVEPSTRVDSSCSSCLSLTASVAALVEEMRDLAQRGEHAHGLTVLKWADHLAALTAGGQENAK